MSHAGHDVVLALPRVPALPHDREDGAARTLHVEEGEARELRRIRPKDFRNRQKKSSEKRKKTHRGSNGSTREDPAARLQGIEWGPPVRRLIAGN